MTRSRNSLICLIIVGLLGLLVPAISLANGGSAGDQQYTDPLASTPTTHSTGTTPSSSSSSGSSSGSAGTTSGSSGSAGTADGDSTTPTATDASSTGTTTGKSSSGKTLPYTGFDEELAGAVGLVLVAGGLSLRRRVRRS